MAVECTINVGFHSNFGMFRQSGHSKILLRLTIINGIPFNPTYNLSRGICYRRRSLSPSLFGQLIVIHSLDPTGTYTFRVFM